MTRPVWRVERVTPAPRRWWQWWRRRKMPGVRNAHLLVWGGAVR